MKNNNEAQADILFKNLIKYIEVEGIDFYKKFTVEEIGDICKQIKEISGIYNNSSFRNAMITMLSCQGKGREAEKRDYFKFINDGKEKEIHQHSKENGRSWTNYASEELYLNEKYIKNIAIKASKAGSNEKDFIKFIEDNSKDIKLKNKKVFKADNSKSVYDSVNISVDNYFEYNNKKIYVEIDSGNMAKLLVGQYTLLSSLSKEDENSIFLVIHYYKGYNADRTNKNLSYVRNKVLNNKGMKFLAIHIDDFKKQVKNGNIDKLLERAVKIK